MKIGLVLVGIVTGVLLCYASTFCACRLKKTTRQADHPIAGFILHRWSPRAMSGEPLSYRELMALFEAARWAPSSFNGQPWRFIYGRRETPAFEKLFDLLVDFNKEWAKNAGVLILVISRKTFEKNNEPSPTHSFDTGAAWENLALQGSFSGLVVHGMSGFDYEKARTEFNIPEGYTIEAMIAVGKPGDTKELPETLQSREKPSSRKKVEEIAFEGEFKE